MVNLKIRPDGAFVLEHDGMTHVIKVLPGHTREVCGIIFKNEAGVISVDTQGTRVIMKMG